MWLSTETAGDEMRLPTMPKSECWRRIFLNSAAWHTLVSSRLLLVCWLSQGLPQAFGTYSLSRPIMEKTENRRFPAGQPRATCFQPCSTCRKLKNVSLDRGEDDPEDPPKRLKPIKKMGLVVDVPGLKRTIVYCRKCFR